MISAAAAAWIARARALLDGRGHAIGAPATGLLEELAAGWRLDALDRDVIALVIGAALDAEVADRFGAGAPTPAALARVLAEAGDEARELEVVLRCSGESRLRRAGLLEVGGGAAVRAAIAPSRRLLGLVQGRMELAAAVAEVGALVPADAAVARGVTTDPPIETLIGLCGGLQQLQRGRGPVALVGEPRSGRLRTALAIAAGLGQRRAIVVEAALVAPEVSAWRALAVQLIAEGAFHLAPVVIREAGAVAVAAAARIAHAGVPCFVTATDEVPDGRCRIHARVVRPSAADQLAAWRDETGGAAWAEEPRLAALAREHVLSRSEIATAAGIASAHEGTAPWVAAATRSQQRSRLDRFARSVVRRVRLDEVVLAPAIAAELRELIAALRARPRLAAAWDLSRALAGSGGVAAMFDGPPGTGKTLSASVVATELDAPLYRVDVASIVDRYVGETEKNLARLFREAEASRGILLFDEADSLFSRRVETRDAMDRFANMQVNQLLTLIEDYPGVSILTTNLKHGLDVAFARRIAYKLQFELPDLAERIALWHMYLPPGQLAPREVAHLAERFDRISGAEIRNAVVRAAVIALEPGRIRVEHVVRALIAELQAAGSVVASVA